MKVWIKDQKANLCWTSSLSEVEKIGKIALASGGTGRFSLKICSTDNFDNIANCVC